MKRIAVLALVGIASSGCGTLTHEPANLDPHKREIRTYVESGQYDRDIAAVAAKARAWLERRAPRGGGKLAMVFDLDETLFSNWPNTRAHDFGYIAKDWTAWVDEGKAPPIEPVRDLYRTARRLGIDVILITGRRERDRPGTEKNLRAIECTDYAALICKPDEAKETSGAFKLAARQRLTAEGWTIVANIGDQESDLAGGFAERTFKLPCPFYFSP